MGIQIISISHKIAPLHVREMFAFTKEQQEEMMRRMTDCLEVSECVVLSTCNRTEMYVYSESGSEGVVFNRMEDVLLECAGAQEEEDIGNYLLFFHGKKPYNICLRWRRGWIPWSSARTRSSDR